MEWGWEERQWGLDVWQYHSVLGLRRTGHWWRWHCWRWRERLTTCRRVWRWSYRWRPEWQRLHLIMFPPWQTPRLTPPIPRTASVALLMIPIVAAIVCVICQIKTTMQWERELCSWLADIYCEGFLVVSVESPRSQADQQLLAVQTVQCVYTYSSVEERHQY